MRDHAPTTNAAATRQGTAELTARQLLDLFNAHLEGEDVDADQARHIAIASAFAAEAYAHNRFRFMISGEEKTLAMCRAFLQALVDFTHPELDHLRARNQPPQERMTLDNPDHRSLAHFRSLPLPRQAAVLADLRDMSRLDHLTVPELFPKGPHLAAFRDNSEEAQANVLKLVGTRNARLKDINVRLTSENEALQSEVNHLRGLFNGAA